MDKDYVAFSEWVRQRQQEPKTEADRIAELERQVAELNGAVERMDRLLGRMGAKVWEPYSTVPPYPSAKPEWVDDYSGLCG